MKKLLGYIDKKILKLRWFDISLIKMASMVFAIMIAKLYPVLLSLELHYYFILILILILRPMKIFLCDKK
jgi:uncharacterized protein YqhQ